MMRPRGAPALHDLDSFRVQRKAPVRLMSMRFSTARSSDLQWALPRKMPALLKSRSSRPKNSLTLAKKAATLQVAHVSGTTSALVCAEPDSFTVCSRGPCAARRRRNTRLQERERDGLADAAACAVTTATFCAPSFFASFFPWRRGLHLMPEAHRSLSRAARRPSHRLSCRTCRPLVRSAWKGTWGRYSPLRVLSSSMMAGSTLRNHRLCQSPRS